MAYAAETSITNAKRLKRMPKSDCLFSVAHSTYPTVTALWNLERSNHALQSSLKSSTNPSKSYIGGADERNYPETQNELRNTPPAFLKSTHSQHPARETQVVQKCSPIQSFRLPNWIAGQIVKSRLSRQHSELFPDLLDGSKSLPCEQSGPPQRSIGQAESLHPTYQRVERHLSGLAIAFRNHSRPRQAIHENYNTPLDRLDDFTDLAHSRPLSLVNPSHSTTCTGFKFWDYTRKKSKAQIERRRISFLEKVNAKLNKDHFIVEARCIKMSSELTRKEKERKDLIDKLNTALVIRNNAQAHISHLEMLLGIIGRKAAKVIATQQKLHTTRQSERIGTKQNTV